MKRIIKVFISIIGLIVLINFFFLGGIDEYSNNELNKIEIQVAKDAEKQYQIALKNGSTMDAYVQANLVSAAYLQAEDEGNYAKWKKIEKQLAQKLGIE